MPNTDLRTIIRFGICIVVAALLANPAFATPQAEFVPIGEGGYKTKRPASCKPLQEQIYKLDSWKAPTPTNQWWSSLVWDKFSNNMFPHPIGSVACEDGLSVGYPGAALVGSEAAIMGGGISSNGDVVIGLDGVKFDDARLADNSGWFVTAQFSSESSNLKTSFGHGSPFVFCTKDAGSFCLRFADKPITWSGDKAVGTIGISVRGNHYGLFATDGSHWNIENDRSVTLESDDDFFSVALLPDNKAETLETFKRCAHNHVTETSFEYRFENGELVTTWKIKTEPKVASRQTDTLTALYPHQWKYSKDSLTGQSYKSVRGEMKLLLGDSFETRVPTQSVLPMLPSNGIPDHKRMEKYLDVESKKIAAPFADTYWEGKHLGKLASLSGICESMGDTRRQKVFIDEIKRRLENWFDTTDSEDAPLFYYDSNWGTLIGSKPSYGSDAELNDHHFHYGYFIRAAAEVARVDKGWAKEWGPMVQLLMFDIASPNATGKFPQLRGFDLYAGHSWASGHARFGDGNNQESSSESMNAWYGMMLWGEATDNKRIRDLGAFLFNTERTAVEEYWFDVSGTNFPAKFPNTAVGMVWGGKGAFATWFSGDADMIHGITWLPFTPASVYLGRFPEYVKKNHAAVVKKRDNGEDFNKGWGDLVVMYNALADPKSSAKYIDQNPECHLEGGNCHPFMYHWIHTLDQLGAIDASVTADHLFANVYIRNGKKTYVIYNFHDRLLEVNFSDGMSLKSKSKGLAVAEGS